MIRSLSVMARLSPVTGFCLTDLLSCGTVLVVRGTVPAAARSPTGYPVEAAGPICIPSPAISAHRKEETA